MKAAVITFKTTLLFHVVYNCTLTLHRGWTKNTTTQMKFSWFNLQSGCRFRYTTNLTCDMSPGKSLSYLQTWLNWMAGDLRLRERTALHRWLPDFWASRKETFPCLTWLKLTTDLPLLSFLSTWLNTGTRPVQESQRLLRGHQWCCPCDAELSLHSLFSFDGIWTHRPKIYQHMNNHTYWTNSHVS